MELFRCYLKGYGYTKDDRKSMYWLKKAAMNGDVDAQLLLADEYAYGKLYYTVLTELADDKSAAVKSELHARETVKWYRKAAEQGSAEAQFRLGRCYQDGNGVAKNRAEAVKWLRKAAQQNLPIAQKTLNDLGESW